MLYMYPDHNTPYEAEYVPRSEYSIWSSVYRMRQRVNTQIEILHIKQSIYPDNIPYEAEYVPRSECYIWSRVCIQSRKLYTM